MPGLAKNAGKCDKKCGFVRMVFATRNPYVSSRLTRSGAQSMDGLMEQLSAVVQLKNITDWAQNPWGQKLQLLGQARALNLRAASRAPPLTQTAGLPRGGGGGTPTYTPQSDPHDALIILNIHSWGKFFQKKFAHQLRLPSAKVRPRGRVGVKILFCVFHPFLNSPQNSEYFEYRHIGSNKKISPCRLPKKNIQRLWRPRPQNLLFLTTN